MQRHGNNYITENTDDITTSSTSLALDLSLNKNFFLTLGANLDTLTLNNIQKGYTYHFVFIQGATMYPVTLPASMILKGDLESFINKSDTITSVIFKAVTTSALVQSSAAASVSVTDQKATWIATTGQTDFTVANAEDNEIFDEYIVTVGGQLQSNITGGNQAYSIANVTKIRDTLRLSVAAPTGAEVVLQYRKETQVMVIRDEWLLNPITFTSTFTLDRKREYSDYTVSANETWNASSVKGSYAVFDLIMDGVSAVSKGTGFYVDYNNFFGTVLSAGTYRVQMIATSKGLDISVVSPGSSIMPQVMPFILGS